MSDTKTAYPFDEKFDYQMRTDISFARDQFVNAV